MELSLKMYQAAQEGTALVTQQTMYGQLPFAFQVDLEPGTEAYVSKDDEIVDPNPTTFQAQEVRSIGQFGVEFYDQNTDRWLKVRGFKFNISPVFNAPPTQAR